MRKRLIALAVVLACSAPVCADYIADRKAAMDLVKAGKNEEAMTAFIEMEVDPLLEEFKDVADGDTELKV